MASDSAALEPIERHQLETHTHLAAQLLLGAYLMRRDEAGLAAGRIVEVEAYAGPDDLASHARAGRTARTAPMFGPVGMAYVYLVYGMHECLNVVAHQPGKAGAVLLRALEPVAGVDLMRVRRDRPNEPEARLAAGPARLCQALAVDRSFSGHDLLEGDGLWLARLPARSAPPAESISSGPRVGVAYAGQDWAARPWRYWFTGHPSVSRP